MSRDLVAYTVCDGHAGPLRWAAARRYGAWLLCPSCFATWEASCNLDSASVSLASNQDAKEATIMGKHIADEPIIPRSEGAMRPISEMREAHYASIFGEAAKPAEEREPSDDGAPMGTTAAPSRPLSAYSGEAVARAIENTRSKAYQLGFADAERGFKLRDRALEMAIDAQRARPVCGADIVATARVFEAYLKGEVPPPGQSTDEEQRQMARPGKEFPSGLEPGNFKL